MATNPYVNKVQLADGTTLIDISSETVTADNIVSGYTAHDKSGEIITGTMPAAVPYVSTEDYDFVTVDNQRVWRYRPYVEVKTAEGDTPGYMADGTHIQGNYEEYTAIPSGMVITPSTSSQTIGDEGCMMEGAVTVSAMPSGTAGTPTASKGAVNNHSISVTPSVTNTTGYITGSTKTGTAVSVSASELVSGTKSITANGTGIDVTNYATADVSVPQDTFVVTIGSDYRQGNRWYIPNETYSEIASAYSSGMEIVTEYDGTSLTNISDISVVGVFDADENEFTYTVHYTSYSSYYDKYIVYKEYYTYTSSSLTRNADGSQYLVPSGNISITGSGTTNVKLYETASVSSGSATPASTISATGASVSTGNNTLTLSKANVLSTPQVSAGYISSGSEGASLVSLTANVDTRSSSDLTAIGATVTAPAGYYSSNATCSVDTMTLPTTLSTGASGTQVTTFSLPDGLKKYLQIPQGYNSASSFYQFDVPSGAEGTPSATKGSVSNHAISVTPSVTNTTGYITGGTKTGTAVSVSASELVSGTLSITQNGTADVTNYASVNVSVSGGGGSSVQIGDAYDDVGTDRTSIVFSGLSGEPTSFYIYADNGITLPSGTPYKTSAVVYDGTSHHAQILTNTSNAQASYDSTSYSHTYNNGTLTISSSGPHFVDAGWVLVYSYGGASSNVQTADVQVGSGATSITFTGLEDEPLCWSCIFKSNFSTSNGYQRVIFTSDYTSLSGLCMDSQARYGQYWTSSYNNGSLTITSQGTNSGGYFHQPGYYQLTYVISDPSPYEKKSATYRASTSAQTDKIEPSSGYDAMSEVNISIPAVTQTNLTAANIKSGTTISISNGQSNLWSVTGTYTGDGGGSASVATTTWTNSSNTATSHQFTGLSGTPKAAFLRCTASLSRSSSSTNYFIADMVWTGTSCVGNSFRRSNGTYANVTSGYSVTTGTNSITFTSSGTSTTNPGSFYNGSYELVYVY